MENWMSKIPDKKKLILLNIPGSHDSAAYNMFFLGSTFSKTQNLDITNQLKIGVRVFDIRVVLKKYSCCEKSEEDREKNTDLICCHGICNCFHIENKKKQILTFKKILTQMKEFLLKNPTEAIIIKNKSGRGKEYFNLKRAEEILFSEIENNFLIEYDKNLTIGEIRGKIVYTTILSNKVSNDGTPVYNSKLDQTTTIINTHRKLFTDLNFHEYKVDGNIKVREIQDLMNDYNPTLEEAETEYENNNSKINFPLNYETSCTGEYVRCRIIPIPLPKTEAKIVNKFLTNFAFKKGYYYGWISVDFVDISITEKIIESNFV